MCSNRPSATKHPCMDYFPTTIHKTERVGIAITLYILFWRWWFRISTGTSALLKDPLRGFSESFQANTEIIPQLGHYNFLPNNFKFISHPATRRFYSFDADSVMKQPTNKRGKYPNCRARSTNNVNWYTVNWGGAFEHLLQMIKEKH
jgi:hypothetical protein